MAPQVDTKHAELLEEGAPTQKTDVPAVDLPNVVEQMRKERSKSSKSLE